MKVTHKFINGELAAVAVWTDAGIYAYVDAQKVSVDELMPGMRLALREVGAQLWQEYNQ